MIPNSWLSMQVQQVVEEKLRASSVARASFFGQHASAGLLDRNDAAFKAELQATVVEMAVVALVWGGGCARGLSLLSGASAMCSCCLVIHLRELPSGVAAARAVGSDARGRKEPGGSGESRQVDG
eukprot:3323805-Pleurochrysis_carterae.AAC.1